VPAGFEAVLDDAELAEGELRIVHVLGQALVLCRVRGRPYACSGECTFEDGGDLGAGHLDGYSLRCPVHGCVFDVRSGRIVSPPADEQLPTYEVRSEGGRLFVAHRPRGF
jgi:nitrite reductase/ring-hydroxylating ferredoxin subunit